MTEAVRKPVGRRERIFARIRQSIIGGFLLLIFVGWLSHKIELARMPPLQRATALNHDGDDSSAFEVVSSIPESSPDYAAAQELKSRIALALAQVMPPHKKAAEANCVDLVKSEEQFPSTIEREWGGLLPLKFDVNYKTRVFDFEIDYTATNSMGARLPYKMYCYATWDGTVILHNRSGR